jgi:hypothetical protein
VFVALLTDGCFLPLWRIWYERSSMALYLRDLWGIIAIGDIFNFGGILSFMSFHFITLANPSFTLLSVSCIKHACAVLSLADLCGPFLRASNI